MGYFDNFDNEPLNKYKKFKDVFFYLWIEDHSNFM
jgi:hypothetical protein